MHFTPDILIVQKKKLDRLEVQLLTSAPSLSKTIKAFTHQPFPAHLPRTGSSISNEAAHAICTCTYTHTPHNIHTLYSQRMSVSSERLCRRWENSPRQHLGFGIVIRNRFPAAATLPSFSLSPSPSICADTIRMPRLSDVDVMSTTTSFLARFLFVPIEWSRERERETPPLTG